ncbi:MAG: type II toxin-antitoxin system HigB family toxin [Bacteroidia bacterium]|nr:type II toxin-antitoxin system HigB family toxin [Bacteroidia bacterium]
MKVHLIRKESLEAFGLYHAQSRGAFGEWLSKVKFADWEKPEDILHTFGSADLLGRDCHRIVSDIGGNKHRLIAKYAFEETQVHLFICWIGTHAEYDRLCRAGEQYTIHSY